MHMCLTVLIVIIVILIVAWALLRNTKTPAPEIHFPHEEAETVEPTAEPPAPARSVEIPAKPDDLKRLDGIGPKVNSVLNSAGITTFTQLAAVDVDKLREILTAAGLRFMDPRGWIEQAALAAEGKFDDLKELQGKLKGGRKID